LIVQVRVKIIEVGNFENEVGFVNVELSMLGGLEVRDVDSDSKMGRNLFAQT